MVIENYEKKKIINNQSFISIKMILQCVYKFNMSSNK